MLSYCGIRVKEFVTDGNVLLLEKKKKKSRKQIMEVRVNMIH